MNLQCFQEVIGRYSSWLTEKRRDGWLVVDLNSAMAAELKARRKADPDYTVSPGGIHPDREGHQWVAAVLTNWFDGIDDSAVLPEVDGEDPDRDRINEILLTRMAVLRNAYVHNIGHNQPGLGIKMSLEDAHKQAEFLDGQLK